MGQASDKIRDTYLWSKGMMSDMEQEKICINGSCLTKDTIDKNAIIDFDSKIIRVNLTWALWNGRISRFLRICREFFL